MNFDYTQWYQKTGVRLPSHLTSPPLAKLELFELPKRSILHYVSDSLVEHGPASDDPIFKTITKPIMMDHVVEVGDTKGNPRRAAITPLSLIKTYHIKNRRFRLMRNLEASCKDINTLVVYNYGILPVLYKYIRSLFTSYYKWWNIHSAVVKKMAENADLVDRHNFLICNLPTILPSISDLRLGSTIVNQKVIKLFNNSDSLMILELWKWLGENRKDSILGKLTDLQLNKIDIVFKESGKYCVMNLGRINRWRIATKEELEANPDANKKGIPAKQIQMRFLHFLMILMKIRSVVGKEETKKNSEDNKLEPEIITKTIESANEEPQDNIEAVAEIADNIVTLDSTTTSADEEIVPDEDLHVRLEKELEELETISKLHHGEISDEGEVIQPVIIDEAPTLEEGVMRICDRLADKGLLTASEYKKYNELSGTYKNIIAPNGKETLDKFITISPEHLKITSSHEFKDIKTVLDKSMLKSSLHDFDEKYIKNVLDKDTAAMVMAIQNAGMAVTDYKVETVHDVMGDYNFFTLKVNPIEGASSKLVYKLPVVNSDGTYLANGVKYFLRKQRGDIPIRKISPDTVTLTSYYGKTFVSRSSKRVNNYGIWLANSVMAKGLDKDDINISKLYTSNVFDNEFKAPRVYSSLAGSFRGFTVTNPTLNSNIYSLNFDHKKREELYGKEAIDAYEKSGILLFGISENAHTRGMGILGTNIYLAIDDNGSVYTCNHGEIVDLCTIEDLLGLEPIKAPIDHAELKVMGRDVPVGIILGYELGLSKLIQLLGLHPRRVNVGTRVNLEDNEYSLVFEDETLVFSRDDKKASIILSGFNEYHKALRNYSVYDFDKPGVYLNVLESDGASTKYLREIDLMYQMFIDPITRDILLEMKEPITFHGLLIRSCAMLLNDQHPDELDPSQMRIKGYERMAGVVYNELVRTIRGHNGRPGKSNKPLEMNPYAVWMSLRQDPAVMIVNDINPIENLKQSEAVTYSGSGGRNSRSMVKHTRQYHKNDMGTISESTVDSTDVAINVFTSADPQFTSLRGMSKRYEIGKTGATALLSTSALNAPCSDTDDGKRVNFVGIQASHVVACAGYSQPAVRTGYEQVIAQRTSETFATAATMDGIVEAIDKTGIIVKYSDGSKVGYQIGRIYGNAAGLVIPHSVITEMKVGQKFKEGEIISYNDGFFEKDLLNKNNVVMKNGITVKTALMESTATLDDCSAISKKTAELMTTRTTKVKNVIVDFKQNIHNLVKINTSLTSEDILCIIEDEVSAASNLFDKESLNTLKILSAMTPQAHANGVLERIEIYYHGEKEDMSESLRELCDISDRELSKRNKSIGKPGFTGKIDENFRIEGESLALDTADIRFYITVDVAAGVGDKGVFANQLKSVIGTVFDDIKTESGTEIGAIFGYKSINARIVNSPLLIGTTTTLLDVIAKRACSLYFNK